VEPVAEDCVSLLVDDIGDRRVPNAPVSRDDTLTERQKVDAGSRKGKLIEKTDAGADYRGSSRCDDLRSFREVRFQKLAEAGFSILNRPRAPALPSSELNANFDPKNAKARDRLNACGRKDGFRARNQ
jgi:hypothetical protein